MRIAEPKPQPQPQPVVEPVREETLQTDHIPVANNDTEEFDDGARLLRLKKVAVLATTAAVSMSPFPYTPLILPTNRDVSSSGDAASFEKNRYQISHA